MKVEGTLKNYPWGIINAVILKAENSYAESINNRIKTVKMRTRGQGINSDSARSFTAI